MDIFLMTLLGTVLIVAVVNDLRLGKIPNYLTYPTVITALAYHGITKGLDGLLFSAGGLAVGIGVFVPPYLMGGMGAGDAKLMGAVGGILGARGTFVAFLFTCVIGGIYALIVLLIKRKKCREFIQRYVMILKTFAVTGHFIPIRAAEDENTPRLFYGVPIALGTLFSIFFESSGHVFPI
jgi:prepilin peptidase CpaA